MSKETQNNELSTDKALHIADVGGSIFFNVPLITYEKTELKLSKEEFEEFKTQTCTSDRAFFIWNKLPKDTRPELEFFMEWFLKEMSEHEFVANDMGNHICNFTPEQQNEMLRIIRQIVAERRQMDIEEIEKQLAYLKETFQNL